ncbi:SsgA family sporulation/cell division regulator [Kitasatospora sp. MMS16-BH015]|uniref:SsgA family sporulation/cell division regulator n=1 Tax=Kitasatospora sp. MMS16-BH015 TaxID=2018025 RepID=UPI0020C258AA|nr:SsgA family sporulation/cell division regulator [Kitasatospora sp. MMS16-BH015]
MRFHDQPEDVEGHHPGPDRPGLRAHLTMELATTPGLVHQLRTDLDYDPADPLVVSLTFHLPGDHPVVWTVARGLLLDGLRGPVGEGDVQVRPHPGQPDRIELQLHSPTGSAFLGASRAALQEVLQRTTLLVPVGAELPAEELDGALTRLLDGAAAGEG